MNADVDASAGSGSAGGAGAIKVVLFDVMDTLVVDPFFNGIEEFFGCPRRELLGALTPDIWPRFERAEIDAATFYATMFHDGRAVDGVGLEAWLFARYRLIDGVQPLLDALSAARVPMAALSNYPSWYDLVERACGLDRWLDGAHVSFRTGVRKPEPDAYLGACARLGVAAHEALFVDDRELNCAAARAVGVAAHRFDGAEGLRDALASAGLPVPSVTIDP
jgi:FMN hydrolase / 5-amino-6-(5-phospho-D-ribitylamino)uracil phosphatase